MDEESDILTNECGRRVDGGVDRISELPDEIIVVILSFLRLKKAAATSVLSSRWSDLWKHTPNLNFDRHILRDYDSDKFIEIVNSVIQSHKALSLKNFRLALPVKKIAKCTVTKWLEFVFSRQVESLKLKFTSNEEDDKLVLEELLRESRICLQPQTDLIFFQSLKRLCLRFLKVSGEDIELFLRNCPLLEQLKIRNVTLTSDVEVCGAKLMLKHLDISFCFCTGEESIKVSAPNLTYMKFADVRGVKMLLENAPKLVEANFRIVRSDFASSTSCYFSQLQILNLDFSNSKVLEVLANCSTQMHNLRKLVIFFIDTYNHNLPLLTALIWAYPLLEEFKLKYYSLRVEKPGYMQVISDIGRSPHQHLKVFELQVFFQQSVSDDFAELLMYISNNCVALRKIIIGHEFPRNDPANRDYLTRRLQGKVPDHIQLDLFNYKPSF